MVRTLGEQWPATPPTVEWSSPQIARIGCCEPPQPLSSTIRCPRVFSSARSLVAGSGLASLALLRHQPREEGGWRTCLLRIGMVALRAAIIPRSLPGSPEP